MPIVVNVPPETQNVGSVDWSNITNKPNTFPPAPHGPTHPGNASDPVPVVTDQASGLAPKLTDNSTQYLNGASPAQYKQVAFSELSGVPATLPSDWNTTVNKPATFPSDWNTTVNKPATFPPTAHAPTHLDNGTDPIPVASTTRTGLVPARSGPVGSYLDVTGNWSVPSGQVASSRKINTIDSVTGGGPLATDLTLSLVNDVLSPANGQTYLYRNGNRGWYLPYVCNILDYGADPTGANDNSTALTNAFNSLPAGGGVIFFPRGNYRFSNPVSLSVASAKSLSILGEGQNATILTNSSVMGSGMLNIALADNTATVHVRDLTIAAGLANAGIGLAISVATSTGTIQCESNELFRVTFRGSDGYGWTNYWTTALQTSYLSNLQLDAVTFCGASNSNNPLGIGMWFLGLNASNIAIVCNLSKCNFEFLSEGFRYGTYAQGISIAQTNFTNCNYGINVPSGYSQLGELSVSDSQFGCFLDCIVINSALNQVDLSNNLFIVPANQTALVFQTGTTTAAFFTIVANSFAASTLHSGNAIYASGLSDGIISANVFVNFSGGIAFSANNANVVVQGNNFAGTLTPFFGAQFPFATLTVLDNLGYNPVGTAALTPGASPWGYTAGASRETLYFYGGTINSLYILGAGWAYTSGMQIELGPHESMTMNYSAAPQVLRSIH